MASFLDIVHERRSCRRYDAEQAVPDNVLEYCLEAARNAPSACNRQPWHFTIVHNPEKRRKVLDKGLLPGIKHDWLYDCPCIVVLSVTPELVVHRLAPFFSRIPYHYVDAGIAGEHFILAATEQGLGTCWVGWIRRRKVKKVLNLKKNQRVTALIATGYPAEPEEGPENLPAKSCKSHDRIARWI